MVIPVILVLLLIMDTVSFSEKILSAGFSLAIPEFTFKEHLLKKETESKGDIPQKSNSTVNSTQVSTITDTIIPDDVYTLIKDAEQKYAQSSNDGKIIEKNYSRQNASSEFNGVYLRNTTLSHNVNISD